MKDTGVDPELVRQLQDMSLEILSEDDSPTIHKIVKAMLVMSTHMSKDLFEEWCTKRQLDPDELVGFLADNAVNDISTFGEAVPIGCFILGYTIAEEEAKKTDAT